MGLQSLPGPAWASPSGAIAPGGKQKGEDPLCGLPTSSLSAEDIYTSHLMQSRQEDPLNIHQKYHHYGSPLSTREALTEPGTQQWLQKVSSKLCGFLFCFNISKLWTTTL